MDKRGSVSVFYALGALPPILLLGAWSIDAARAWVEKGRLRRRSMPRRWSLRGSSTTRTATRSRRRCSGHTTPVGRPSRPWSSRRAIERSTAANTNVSSVTETLRNSLPGGGQNGNGAGTTSISGASYAKRANTGVELALVMDVTMTMSRFDTGGSADQDGKKPARIELARRAARDLTSILYGAEQVSQMNLYISVVPFNNAINIGNGDTQKGWLTVTAPSYTSPNTQSHPSHTWAGCIKSRVANSTNSATNAAVLEAAPTGANKFTPYWWPNTYNSAETSAATVVNGRTVQPFCTATRTTTPATTQERAALAWGTTTGPPRRATKTKTRRSRSCAGSSPVIITLQTTLCPAQTSTSVRTTCALRFRSCR